MVDIHSEETIYAGKKAWISVAHDITRHVRAQEIIKNALHEKEILLKEIHHRVKNNLQSLIHLIEMQAETISDPSSISTLEALRGRITAMALVHKKLYQEEDLARIDFREYLENLTANLFAFMPRGRDTSLNLNSKDLIMNINQAIPCGLIVNELVTNALKYAFPDPSTSEKTIQISLYKENKEFVLQVSDDGIGLPEGFNWRKTETLGLKLVNIWATFQLSGSIDVNTQAGTSFIIRFPAVKVSSKKK